MVAIPHSKPWLIAAWPGMGNVAVIAAKYLIHRLGLQPVDELPAGNRFDVQHVGVRAGIIAPPRRPRSVFYRLPLPPSSASPDMPGDAGAAASDYTPSGRDLIVFVGDAQPSSGGYGFARALLDRAEALGAGRVLTFASMASQLHPSQDPHVFGAATDHDTLIDLKKLGVETLGDGQIGGLNGVLLGAASERAMSGLCLLGEIPFFAAGVPNPKGAMAVLEAFSSLSGIEIDLSDLARDAANVDRALIELLEKMQADSRKKEGDEGHGGDEGYEESEPESEFATGDGEGSRTTQQNTGRKTLDAATSARIEHLFSEAAADRAKGVGLKQELDRLGVYAQYENRFLDLFKRAG